MNYRSKPPTPEQLELLLAHLPEYQKENVYKKCAPIVWIITHRLAARLFTGTISVLLGGMAVYLFVARFENRNMDHTIGYYAAGLLTLGVLIGFVATLVYLITGKRKK